MSGWTWPQPFPLSKHNQYIGKSQTIIVDSLFLIMHYSTSEVTKPEMSRFLISIPDTTDAFDLGLGLDIILSLHPSVITGMVKPL